MEKNWIKKEIFIMVVLVFKFGYLYEKEMNKIYYNNIFK